jgi:prophage antirepressor-like protein
MGELESNPEKRIALFQRQEVRRVIHHHEWWFVITDVVAALTDSGTHKVISRTCASVTLNWPKPSKGGKLPPLVSNSTRWQNFTWQLKRSAYTFGK